MILRLSELPDTLRGPDDADYNGLVPRRARFLEPGAAASTLQLVAKYPWLTFTDVYRSPDASLAARRTKRGVQPPGFSAHNFGLAWDLDVGACLRGGTLKYVELVEQLTADFWFCHRRDLDQTASESWHFNYLGPDWKRFMTQVDPQAANTWSWAVEARIVELYGEQFKLDDRQVQEGLAALKFYSGAADGSMGPLTREAVGAFQRAWGLPDDGLAGSRTRRVLAVVTAKTEVVSAGVA